MSEEKRTIEIAKVVAQEWHDGLWDMYQKHGRNEFLAGTHAVSCIMSALEGRTDDLGLSVQAQERVNQIVKDLTS